MSNRDEINSRAESFLQEWLPHGHKEGNEWRCGGIDGSKGRSLSVNMDSGRWHDHATSDSGGDLISLYAAIHHVGYKDAARALESQLGLHRPAPRAQPKNSVESSMINPVPENAPAAVFSHGKHGKPSATWTYRNPDGSLCGYVCRFELEGGKKAVLPMTYQRVDGESGWRWKGFGEKRPLYRIETVDSGRVIIVEGEKCADALAVELPDENVISWQGGTNSVRFADWDSIKGREVIIWPDADPQGKKAANEIRIKLGPNTRILSPPEGKPKGWDCADAIAEKFDCEAFVSTPVSTPGQVVDVAGSEESGDDLEGPPFIPLGVEDGKFYYLSKAGNQIVSMTAAAHGVKTNLFQLAPLSYWEANFPGRNDNFDVSEATTFLINTSMGLPLFNISKIRRRGVWMDDGRVVFHAGDRVLIDGVESSLFLRDSKYAYPKHHRLDFPEIQEAPETDGRKLLELCQALNWRDDYAGTMLAGWLFLAPIAGVLPWRPHIWITGQSGAGKSWILENIVKSIIGDFGLNFSGNTTEAGVRGKIAGDALPVIFDEAEAQNQQGMERMDRVIELARQSSSKEGGHVTKGTASGGTVTYLIRSMFAFSSIGVAAIKRADTSRITALELKKRNSPDGFSKSAALAADSIFREGFGDLIRHRMIANVATTLKTVDVFRAEAAKFFGDARTGDQIGTLMGGAYALCSDEPATEYDARQWLGEVDLSDKAPDPEESDEAECLEWLLRYIVRDGSFESSLQTVIEESQRGNEGGHEDKLLTAYGIRYSNGYLYIANKGAGLERIYKDTQWAGQKWNAYLRRIDGATSHRFRFPRSGGVSRGTKIPFLISGDIIPD